MSSLRMNLLLDALRDAGDTGLSEAELHGLLGEWWHKEVNYALRRYKAPIDEVRDHAGVRRWVLVHPDWEPDVGRDTDPLSSGTLPPDDSSDELLPSRPVGVSPSTGPQPDSLFEMPPRSLSPYEGEAA